MSLLKPLGISALLLGGLLTFPAHAKVAPSALLEASFQTAQNSEQSPNPSQGRAKAGWESLGLTDAQKTQIQQIKAASRQQIEAVLTAEQREQWRLAKSQTPRQKPNLNLSEDQKSRIKAIREQSKSQIDAVLTPEQRQKRQELRQQWQQQKQQRS